MVDRRWRQCGIATIGRARSAEITCCILPANAGLLG
jgi:hypothetical protein